MNSPIARARQPGFNESSSMRSVRDADATDRQWIKNKDTSDQTWGIVRSVAKLSRDVAKLRRRILGGGSAPASTNWFQGEWDPGTTYTTGQGVAFTPDGGSAGMYIALQNVPAGTSPDTGAPNWFAFPNSPPGNWG